MIGAPWDRWRTRYNRSGRVRRVDPAYGPAGVSISHPELFRAILRGFLRGIFGIDETELAPKPSNRLVE